MIWQSFGVKVEHACINFIGFQFLKMDACGLKFLCLFFSGYPLLKTCLILFIYFIILCILNWRHYVKIAKAWSTA